MFERLTGTAFLTPFAIGAAALAMGYWIVRTGLRPKRDPVETERRRRMRLNESGRIAEGHVDFADNFTLHYSYVTDGVRYRTTQSLAGLEHLMPGRTVMMSGPASVKYHPQNPLNSMVICEQWSGFARDRQELRKGA